MRRRDRSHVGRALAAVAACAVVLVGCGSDAPVGTTIPGVRPAVTLPATSDREPLPELGDYPLVSDEDVTAALADYRGEVVVLNFWASWCGPCRDEQPELNEAYEALEGLPVRFLGVNFREDTLPNARAHVREFAMPYDSLHDPTNTIAAALQVPTIPATVLIDPAGRIAGRLPGVILGPQEVVAFAERLAREAG